MHLFQSKYQAADVLLVDDIQCLIHKEATQEAFFQLFNLLYDAQKQIVCSGDMFPLEMNGIAERLRSRLACGLIIDVHVPSYEAKITILKKKAALHGEHVPDDVIDFLASHGTANIRELEGVLIRIFAFASLTKQPITLDLAQSVLAPSSVHGNGEVSMHADFNRIIKCVGKFYKYGLDDLCSKGRNQELVFARQVAMFLMKKMTNKSLRDIGAFLGNRNHATVKHGLVKIEEQARCDQAFLAHIKRMQQEVMSI
jgi:chromosomal replication initiator protein